MKNQSQNHLQELSSDEISKVSGGIIFAPLLFPAFVSGAKWGAGVVIAIYLIHEKYDK